MKNLFRIFVIFSIVAAAACDVIEAPYIETPEPPDPEDTIVRKILIEDFTGHLCPNCPGAAEKAHMILEAYPGRVIVTAVHATSTFAGYQPPNYTLDLISPQSTDLDNYFNVSASGYPKGLINRKEFDGSVIVDPGSWSSLVAQLFLSEPDADINVTRTFNSGTSTVDLTAKVDFFKDFSSPVMISAYLTEDSLVGYQKNSDPAVGLVPEIPDYVFMHVLRGSMNGTWGDTLSATGVTAGTQLSKSLSYTLTNGTWNKDHMHIVVFIYDAVTLEVIQTEEIKLK